MTLELSLTEWPRPMYKLHPWKPEIETVIVARMTKCFVILVKPGNREWKEQHEGKYFATWGEAHAKLVENSRRAVEESKSHLHRVRTALGQVESLKDPTS